MKIYNYHPDTYEYLGEGVADPDPLDPGNWLIPGNSVTFPPPDAIPGKNIHFEDGSWIYKDIPPEPEHPSVNYTYKDFRQFEYPDFINYLDGIVKGDQEQIQAYIDACLAVKAKYPKPSE
jgi:hypothetical protein